MTTSTLNKSASTLGAEKTSGVSLKASIFAVTMVAAMIPLSIYGIVNYSKTTDQHNQDIQKNLAGMEKSNKASARLVKAWLDGNATTVRSISFANEITGMNIDVALPMMKKVNEEMKEFSSLILLDSTGMQITRTSAEKLVDSSMRKYFKNPMAGAPMAVESAMSRTLGVPYIALSSPVIRDGVTVGVIAAHTSAGSVVDKITGGKIGETGISYLIDTSTNSFLSHPNVKLIGEKIDAITAAKLKGNAVGKVADGVNAKGEAVKVTATRVSDDLMLFSEVNTAEIEKDRDAAQSSMMLYIGGAIMLSALLAFLMARLVSMKIIALAKLISGVSVAKHVSDIEKIEAKIDAIGGATEMRLIASAIRRLTGSIKLAMRSI